jgi:septum site-determining protein MinC
LILHLPSDAPLPALLGEVRGCIDGGGEFFKHAELVIDYGSRVPNVEEIVALRALLEERGIRLRTVIAGVQAHRELLRSWGYLPLRVLSNDGAEGGSEAVSAQPDGEHSALYVRRTLRSGSAIRTDGDIVVLGDVNAGAEVVAGGDVIVWGAIRGTVHAGMDGDFGAIICALRFQPTQLRIANIYARPPDQRPGQSDVPMLARLHNGEIVVEPWRADRRPSR